MHINFAPSQKFKLDLETIKKFRLTRQNMVVIAGSILCFMILFGGCQKARLVLLESTKARLDAQTEEMKKKADDKGINVSVSTGRMPAIKSFEKRVSWSKVLYDVSSKVPDNIWIISMLGTAKDLTVKLDGEGPDHPSVAALVNSLSKMPVFSDVTLISSDVIAEKGVNKMKFMIECKLKL